MTAQLAADALHNAVLRRLPAATVVHSDTGSQFRSHAFVAALRRHKLHGSMGRVGACADNAAMESYFSLLQKNALNPLRWTSRQLLRLAVIYLHRRHLPPPTSTRHPRPAHAHRVRDTSTSRHLGLTIHPNESIKAGAD